MPEMTVAQAFQLALSHHQSGRLDDAEKLYRIILNAHPQHSDCLHLCGVIAHQRGNNIEAIDLIGRALVEKPDVPEYNNNIAEAFRAIGRLQDAKEHYGYALKANPDYVQAHANLGICLSYLGEAEKGMFHLTKALALEPENIRANIALADALTEQSKLQDALAVIRSLLRKHPNQQQAKERQHNLERRLRLEGGSEVDDQALFKALRQSIEKKETFLVIDVKRFSHPDCPIVIDYLNTRFLYLFLVAIPASFYFMRHDMPKAIMVSAAVATVFMCFGRPLLHALQRKSARRQVLEDSKRWKAMWQFGSLSLCFASNTPQDMIKSPDQDWRIFARKLLPKRQAG